MWSKVQGQARKPGKGDKDKHNLICVLQELSLYSKRWDTDARIITMRWRVHSQHRPVGEEWSPAGGNKLDRQQWQREWQTGCGIKGQEKGFQADEGEASEDGEAAFVGTRVRKGGHEEW